MMENGQPFPHRDLILFITFVVILVTLIVQGLTLPALIQKLNLSDSSGGYISEEESESFLRKGMRRIAISYLNENYKERRNENEYFNRLMDRWEQEDRDDSVHKVSDEVKEIYFKTLEQQRIWLREENRRNPNIDEEYIRHYLTRLDLEEERLRM